MHPHSTTLVEYICRHCAEPFSAAPRRNRAYCSTRCKHDHHGLQTYHCKQCGAAFESRPLKGQRPRVYCSVPCRAKGLAIPMTTRFWARVTRLPGAEDCWVWTGLRNDGYGLCWRGGLRSGHELAHRVAWYLATGIMPTRGQLVGHTCDNRACVRHDDTGVYVVDGVEYPRRGHLFLTTYNGNSRDMVAKGRSRAGDNHPWRQHPGSAPRGVQNGNARLTAGQVTAIREVYATGRLAMPALAEIFGISRDTVAQIVRERTWRHLL